MSCEAVTKTALTFDCGSETLVGILHTGQQKNGTGVLFVVGGPQYRIGSHRHFYVLAQEFARAGIPAFRFDVRGMGDSSGSLHDFESIDADIKAAIDAFFKHSPEIKKVILWGLCDAASASLFYGYQDPRVSGMILLNPWVRTDEGEAKAYLKHYYRDRLLQKEFWLKLMKGGINPAKVLGSFFSLLQKAKKKPVLTQESSELSLSDLSLPEKMLSGLKKFSGKLLIILSGDDLTAQEFSDLISENTDWKQTLDEKNAKIKTIEKANHTFSDSYCKNQVNRWCIEWINSSYPT